MTTEQTDDATGNTDVDPEVGGVEKSTRDGHRRGRSVEPVVRPPHTGAGSVTPRVNVTRWPSSGTSCAPNSTTRQRADVEALASRTAPRRLGPLDRDRH
ncbi:MAG: hypothetical protein WKF73_05725 [Nocardioidaceae bacterium]